MTGSNRTRGTGGEERSPYALRQRKRQRAVALLVVFSTVVPLLAALFRG